MLKTCESCWPTPIATRLDLVLLLRQVFARDDVEGKKVLLALSPGTKEDTDSRKAFSKCASWERFRRSTWRRSRDAEGLGRSSLHGAGA
jgi:hypothetical protein